jgi:hypothetical protein
MAYSKKQKGQSRRRRTYKRSHSRSKQTGGAIISPAIYSNSNNAHFSGIGFTDPTGAVTGCTGGGAGNIYTTIGGIRTPITMKGGSRKRSCATCNRCKCVCRNKSKMRRRRMQRGGNTNGYSIGGVHLRSNLVGISNNYHTPFDSCKG